MSKFSDGMDKVLAEVGAKLGCRTDEQIAENRQRIAERHLHRLDATVPAKTGTTTVTSDADHETARGIRSIWN